MNKIKLPFTIKIDKGDQLIPQTDTKGHLKRTDFRRGGHTFELYFKPVIKNNELYAQEICQFAPKIGFFALHAALYYPS